jgi:hypothetical protein
MGGLPLEVTVPLPLPAFAAVKGTWIVKLVELVAVPPGVVTPSGPVVAPVGTVAWIDVAEITEKFALTPLKVTPVAPVKFVPLIVTVDPTGPLAGAKLAIVGGCRVKVAVTDLAAFMFTVHVAPETESHPLQRVNEDPVAGVAVRVTTVPSS